MITPSQTVGPFFGPALLRDRLDTIGTGELRLEGRVLDGDGAPVPDALLEFWRDGFARVGTDDEGQYAIRTSPAPYLSVTVHARGLLNHLDTRVYFTEPAGPDPVWQHVPANRRQTLLARPVGAGHQQTMQQVRAGGKTPPGGVATYHWDVVLQGDAETETVFFAWQR